MKSSTAAEDVNLFEGVVRLSMAAEDVNLFEGLVRPSTAAEDVNSFEGLIRPSTAAGGTYKLPHSPQNFALAATVPGQLITKHRRA